MCVTYWLYSSLSRLLWLFRVFLFPNKFQNYLSKLSGKCKQSFDKGCNKVVDSLSGMVILTIKILPVYEFSLSFHHLLLSSVSFMNAIQSSNASLVPSQLDLLLNILFFDVIINGTVFSYFPFLMMHYQYLEVQQISVY